MLQAVSRLKLRKKLKYVIGQYNGVVAEHNTLQVYTRIPLFVLRLNILKLFIFCLLHYSGRR